jgi:hypothetical protein
LNEGRLLGDRLLHRRVNPVENTRNAEEQGGLHLGEVVDELGDRFADGHARARREEGVELARLTEGVRPRQEREAAIFRRHREDFVDGGDVGRDVLVGENDPLRIAGGAARIDEAGHVFLLRLDGRDIPFRLEERAVVVDVARAVLLAVGLRCAVRFGSMLEIDDVLERRDRLEELFALLDDGARGDDGDRRIAVAKDEVPVLLELRLVHGDERGSETKARVRGHGPLDAVVRDDGYLIARLHPERGQPRAELVRFLAELGVGRPLPMPAALGAEEFAIRKSLDAAFEDVDEGLEAVGLSHRGVAHDFQLRLALRYPD